jgi:hypothetical protein
VPLVAHIGKVPVEEWLPFLVPLVALYVYGRYKYRRRREALQRLPDPSALLDESIVGRVHDRWSAAGHKELSAEVVPLLYPPGPDGLTAAELAGRLDRDAGAVERLLEELAELGYVDLEEDSAGETRAWLTIEGHVLMEVTEGELLAAAAQRAAGAG